jgi:acetyl esterase/lipase
VREAPTIPRAERAADASVPAEDASSEGPEDAASWACDPPPIPGDAGITHDAGGGPGTWVEVPYGSDVKQTFDVVAPEKVGAPRPMIVFVHGGGWTAGDKHLFWPAMRALATRGYVTATVNYRLARDAARAFPVGVQDVRCAVATVVSRAAEWGADPGRVVLWGASAGGHLAALVGLAPDAPLFRGPCAASARIEVRGVVSYYAPLDLVDTERRYPKRMHAAVLELFRKEPGTPAYEAMAKAASPATWVGPGAPPVLLVHGSADRIVPPDDSRRFQRALQAAGVPSALIELPGEDHGFGVLSRRDSLRPATCAVLAFLDRVLRP